MASEKQIKANQQNASKSLGPKTKEGKAIAKLNSMKHGLLSQKMEILPTEDKRDFDELAASLMNDLKPQGELENILVEQIISATWRLRRIQQIETGLLVGQYYRVQTERANIYTHPEILAEVAVVDSSLEGKSGYEEAVRRDQEIKKILESEIPTLGEAFNKAQDSLSRLSRYQSAIERSLYKALAELERLQSRRRIAEKPVIIDVTETLD